jgi:pyruvate dehydrogenase E2 component (dihydrolipoamide acetyltransferase)
MAIKLIMPKLGLNMVEGELTQWLKKEGDPVTKGEIIYMVETDKVANDVESPEDGILYKILVKAGEVVPVRKVVGVLVKEGENVNLRDFLEQEPGKETTVKSETNKKATEKPTQSPGFVSGSGQIFASPLVKRMAAESGIDLSLVKGSGPDGRIMSADIEKMIATNEQESEKSDLPGKMVPLVGMRKVVAERMSLSANTMAMVTLNSELNVTPLVDYREKLKKTEKIKSDIPGINAIIIALTAKALKEFPYLNASFTDQGIRLIGVVNIGLAVDTPEGLLVVVVREADKKTVVDIHNEVNLLVERALSHKNTPLDLSGSTFTLTNLGIYGIDSFTPIINPPEAGILGICRFTQKDILVEGEIERKIMANFSLTFDHRVIDGAPAARFLKRVGELIAEFE